jgi:hypothetical protein
MPQTGQTNNRKIEVPQSSFNRPAKVDQVPPVRNPNVITGPQESREERSTRRLGELRKNAPPQNIVKEAVPQQAAPVRPAIVLERKIEIQRKVPEVPINEQRVRTEVRQQQNQKPMENVKIAPPVRSNSQATISQPPAPPQNTEKTQAAPKVEQNARQKASSENVQPEDNVKNLNKKEAKTEMQQRRR